MKDLNSEGRHGSQYSLLRNGSHEVEFFILKYTHWNMQLLFELFITSHTKLCRFQQKLVIFTRMMSFHQFLVTFTCSSIWCFQLNFSVNWLLYILMTTIDTFYHLAEPCHLPITKHHLSLIRIMRMMIFMTHQESWWVGRPLIDGDLWECSTSSWSQTFLWVLTVLCFIICIAIMVWTKEEKEKWQQWQLKNSNSELELNK